MEADFVGNQNGHRLDGGQTGDVDGGWLHLAIIGQAEKEAQLAHQRLEQQREPAQTTRKARPNLACRANGQRRSRGAIPQVAFMLEEIQMQVGLGVRFMQGIHAFVIRSGNTGK